MDRASPERSDVVQTSAVPEPSRALRADLPPLPGRMAALPVDRRGYPVPWFVKWIGGAPDFRVMDAEKWERAVSLGNCWICGEKCGKWRTFVIGPMCGINRTTSEPPCHDECALFAAAACPFMVLPRAQRREANLPAGYQEAPGFHLDRNPGVTCLWTTDDFLLFKVPSALSARSGERDQLIRIGKASTVRFFAQGRPATRAEVVASIEGGLPALWEVAAAHGESRQLAAAIAEFTKYLP